MAVDFQKGLGTRTSEYLFDPKDIKIKAEFNGRHVHQPVDDLIADFLDIGQLEPCLIGNDGGIPILYAGHRRWRAAIEINKKKLTPEPFRLRCVYFKGDERTAFFATVKENHIRRATDEIDDAHNIAKMERWGMSHEAIAKIYHEDVSWVKKRLALLTLCEDGVSALRDGSLKPSAAVVIAKMAKEAQKETLASGKTTVRAIAEASGKPKKFGLSDVKTEIRTLIETDFRKRITGLSPEAAVELILSDLLAKIEGKKDALAA